MWPITLAQSCGALNDNLVKNAMLVLALFKLDVGGTGLSALAGALFIAPYVLLSATAGMLADRFSKPDLVRIYKVAEIGLMLAAAVAFLAASVPALLAVLVGLGIQAALFGPVKYGVLPEYLAGHELISGNGLIEATTFLSIVLGTVAGGALILPAQGPAIVGAVGVALSLVGLAAAMCMPRLPPSDPALRLTFNIAAESWRVVRAAAAIRPVWLSVLGLSWFWTMGATLMTEFPIVARDTMHADGTVLTLLLTVFAVGVGIGSMLCPSLQKGEATARFVPLAGLGISIFCWDFANAAVAAHGVTSAGAVLTSWAGMRLAADLLLLAMCGGLYSVPLYVLLQKASPPVRRCRMVAANNIMNALFMVLGAAAAAGFAAIGLDAPATLRIAAVANLLAAGWLLSALRRPASTGEVIASKLQ
jgi:acyl-[acyl-carrier-protein]-phospholipid O-acyltransferase/long-chain-fatty-acid--[acyl-carrier-protein] ligase